MKSIIITGASSGIGAALALQYAKAGVRLGLVARNAVALGNVAQQCQEKGAQTVIGVIDVRDRDQLVKWIIDFDNQYAVDTLIANAGVASMLGENGEPEAWDAIRNVIDTNVYGVIASIEALITPMRQRQKGCIVIISSLAAYRGLPLTPSYCASKAAVKSYGEALRGWLRADGVQVNVVCPGFVESDMSRQFPAKKPLLMTSEKAARIIAKGVVRNEACIAFPFPLSFGSWLLSVIPAALADFILSWFGYGAKGKLRQ